MNEKNFQTLLIPKKEENKTIHFKKLNFNPLSFFTNKHKHDIKQFIKKKSIFENISYNNKKESESINYNFITRKKLKLKPLNVSRSNFNFKNNYKIDDIFIPSNQTTKELIQYNKANMHNTLLNYYNKNNRNLKIINFIKTKSFEQNQNFTLSKKLNSSYESFNNNNSSSFIIPNINNNQQNLEELLKNNLQMKNTLSEEELKKLRKKKKVRKSTIDIYESEILENKQIQRNLIYFHDFLFDKDDKSISNKSIALFKPENKMQSSKIDLSNSTKKRLDIHKINNNNIFGFVTKNKTRNKKTTNDNNAILSLKEMRALSFQGYKKMKADKKKQFDFKLKNTNNEVFKLEQKLDEIFEKNRQIFSKFENEL